MSVIFTVFIVTNGIGTILWCQRQDPRTSKRQGEVKGKQGSDWQDKVWNSHLGQLHDCPCVTSAQGDVCIYGEFEFTLVNMCAGMLHSHVTPHREYYLAKAQQSELGEQSNDPLGQLLKADRSIQY